MSVSDVRNHTDYSKTHNSILRQIYLTEVSLEGRISYIAVDATDSTKYGTSNDLDASQNFSLAIIPELTKQRRA